MSRARDFQQSKVYNAEWDCSFSVQTESVYNGYRKQRTVIPLGDVLTLEQCQVYVDQVIQSPNMQKWREVDKITVKNGRVCAIGYVENKEIALPEWARVPTVILHEVAHVVIPDDLPWHGKEFAGLLLELYREFLGEKQANELEFNYIKRGVQYG
jgi:putative metallohydrolase (TIGR04338 family)